MMMMLMAVMVPLLFLLIMDGRNDNSIVRICLLSVGDSGPRLTEISTDNVIVTMMIMVPVTLMMLTLVMMIMIMMVILSARDQGPKLTETYTESTCREKC